MARRDCCDWIRGWELLAEGEGEAGSFAAGDLVGRCEGLVADEGVVAEAGRCRPCRRGSRWSVPKGGTGCCSHYL